MKAQYHRKRGHAFWGRRFLSIMVLLFFMLNTTMAFALPSGPQVVNGQVSFNTQGNTMTVTNSPNAIINWQGFSINSAEATRFIQQNSSSAVLNRIIGQDPSVILGALQSNGKVFLINPNGILFGQGSRIDVNGLVASTLNLSNQDFLAGNYNFTLGLTAGAVQNQGTITTPSGGKVYLIAPNVENSGIINSPQGEVLLAAGHTVQLVDSSSPDIAVVLSAPEHQAVNVGQIIAESGKVGIYAGLIKQSGTVSANSAVVGENGRIMFKAVKDITLDAGSVTSATGGRIEVLGDMEIGTVNVGGALDASAPNGGDGGFIETSAAHVKIDDSARVTTLAPYGKTGVWLIDPNDFTIAARGGDMTGQQVSDAVQANNFEIATATMDTAGGNGDIFVNDSITWSAPYRLTLSADHDILINGAITGSDAGSILSLSANNQVSQTAPIVVGGLELLGAGSYALTNISNHVDTLAADITGSIRCTDSGSFAIGTVGGTTDITTQGGNVILTGTAVTGGSISTSTTDGSPGGNINVTATAGDIGLADLDSHVSSDGDAGNGGAVMLSALNGAISVGMITTYTGGPGTGGSVTMEAMGDIYTGGNIQTYSTGSNATGDGGAVTLTSSNGSVTVGDGLGSIETYSRSYSNVSGTGGAVTMEALGGIYTGDINTYAEGGWAGDASNGGAVSLTSTGGAVSAGGIDAGSRVSEGPAGAGGAVTIQASQDIDTSGITAGTISLASTGGLIAGSGILTGTGLTATAAKGITLSGDNVVPVVSLTNTSSGNITYMSDAGAGNSLGISGSNSAPSGLFTVIEGSGSINAGAISANNGSIVLSSEGDMQLSSLVDAGSGAVALTAGGAIIDGNGSANNITASSLIAEAGGGIGHGDAIETKVHLLDALNNGADTNIEITNTGVLTVADIRNGGDIVLNNTGAVTTGTSSIESTGGVVTLIAHSPLTIGAGGVSASGDVKLEAAASGSGDDLTINGDVTSTNGSIVLKAGDSISGSGALNAPNGTIVKSFNLNGSAPAGETPSATKILQQPEVQKTTSDTIVAINTVTDVKTAGKIVDADKKDDDKKKDDKTNKEENKDGDKKDDTPQKQFCN